MLVSVLFVYDLSWKYKEEAFILKQILNSRVTSNDDYEFIALKAIISLPPDYLTEEEKLNYTKQYDHYKSLGLIE